MKKQKKLEELTALLRAVEEKLLRLEESCDEDAPPYMEEALEYMFWEGLKRFIEALLPLVEGGKKFSLLSLSSSSDMGEGKWSEERAKIQELPEGLLVKISRESSWAGDRPRGISGYHAYEEGEEKFLPYPVVVLREEKVWVPGAPNQWSFGVKAHVGPGKVIDGPYGQNREEWEVLSRLLDIVVGGEK